MKRTKHTIAIILLLISFVLITTGCDSENSKSYAENNYNYPITISDEALVKSAVYNNTYEFASKAKVSSVDTIVIASCSKISGDTWRVMGHFYGQDSYGHTEGVYNFTCDVSVQGSYTTIFRCIVEKDY